MSGNAARRAFERAAASYDAHSVLQREVGRRLLEHLDGIVLDPAVILDLGCATGDALEALHARYPRARIVAIDFAERMLLKAAARKPWWKRALGATQPVVCADAHCLPIAAGRVQFVFSNLMLQWCDPRKVFAEAARVLPPGGLLMFSTFGPDTLKELRAAFAAAGDPDRVNRFVDMHDLGDMLVHAGFADPVMEMEMLTLEYESVDALVRELHAVGSHARAGTKAADVSRDALRDAYEKHRRGGALPATHEIVYGHAWKVAPKRLADGRQVIQFETRP